MDRSFARVIIIIAQSRLISISNTCGIFLLYNNSEQQPHTQLPSVLPLAQGQRTAGKGDVSGSASRDLTTVQKTGLLLLTVVFADCCGVMLRK